MQDKYFGQTAENITYYTDKNKIALLANRRDMTDARPLIWVGMKQRQCGTYIMIQPLEIISSRTFDGIPCEDCTPDMFKWIRAKRKSTIVSEADEYYRKHVGFTDKQTREASKFLRAYPVEDMDKIREAYRRGYLVLKDDTPGFDIEFNGDSYRIKRRFEPNNNRALIPIEYANDNFEKTDIMAKYIVQQLQREAQERHALDMEDDKQELLSRMDDTDRIECERILKCLTWSMNETIRWFGGQLLLGNPNRNEWHVLYSNNIAAQ